MQSIQIIPDRRVTEATRQALLPLAEKQREELPGLVGRWIDGFVTTVDHFYLIVGEDDLPVGLLHWSGPPEAVTPSWWIGVKRQGHGKAAVRLLAHEMVGAGVTGIGGIVIDGVNTEFMAASKKLAQELRAEFARASEGRSESGQGA